MTVNEEDRVPVARFFYVPLIKVKIRLTKIYSSENLRFSLCAKPRRARLLEQKEKRVFTQ